MEYNTYEVGRRSGKTTRCIIESAKSGKHIVCGTKKSANHVENMAKQMGIKIPKVLADCDLRNMSRGVLERNQFLYDY